MTTTDTTPPTADTAPTDWTSGFSDELKTLDANALRRALAPVHRTYAGNIHARLKRSGHFWQGRFGCVAMDEDHLGAALRYIALNPVARGCAVVVFGALGTGRTLQLGDAGDDDRYMAATSVAAAGSAEARAATGFGYKNTILQPIDHRPTPQEHLVCVARQMGVRVPSRAKGAEREKFRVSEADHCVRRFAVPGRQHG